MKYECLECGCEFDLSQAQYRKEDDDFKYGETFMCCPNCESFDFEEIEEEE